MIVPLHPAPARARRTSRAIALCAALLLVVTSVGVARAAVARPAARMQALPSVRLMGTPPFAVKVQLLTNDTNLAGAVPPPFRDDWGPAALDYQQRSLTAELPAAAVIDRFDLLSREPTTRVGFSDYRVFTSVDNVIYQELTDWTLTSWASGGGMTHSFAGFSVTARYVKVATTYTGSTGYSFILNSPAADFQVYAQAPAEGEGWVASWAASSQTTSTASPGGTGTPVVFNDQTVRMVVTPHVGGDVIRLRLTNRFGSADVAIGSVYVGLAGAGAAITPGTSTPVTFGGSAGTTIGAGLEVVSDPISLGIEPFQKLTVSMHVVGDTVALDRHFVAWQHGTYWSPADSGSLAGQEAATNYAPIPAGGSASWFALDAVQVLAPRADARTVVALGDSLTDGTGTTVGADHRYTDYLAQRVLDTAGPSGPDLAIVNAGIAGGRLTIDDPRGGGTSLSGLARFVDDVVNQPNPAAVIVFMGGNDLGQGVAAADVMAGLRQLANRAQGLGIDVIVATVPPRGATASQPFEIQRGQLNTLIRASTEFDAVVDVDAVLRDPAAVRQLQSAYDSGDGIHLTDAGAAAVADAVDLTGLRAMTSD